MKKDRIVLTCGLIIGASVVIFLLIHHYTMQSKEMEGNLQDDYSLTEQELEADTKTLLLSVLDSKYAAEYPICSAESNPEWKGDELEDFNGYQELIKREDFIEVLNEYREELSEQEDSSLRKDTMDLLLEQNEVKELIRF